MTAYRQRALICAAALAQGVTAASAGPSSRRRSQTLTKSFIETSMAGSSPSSRSLRPDRDRSEGASALAADDFVSRFAIPSNRRIEADHCLKTNRGVNLAKALGTTENRANPGDPGGQKEMFASSNPSPSMSRRQDSEGAQANDGRSVKRLNVVGLMLNPRAPARFFVKNG